MNLNDIAPEEWLMMYEFQRRIYHILCVGFLDIFQVILCESFSGCKFLIGQCEINNN